MFSKLTVDVGCLADVYGMFRGCLGDAYGRFRSGDVLQRSDARTHARAREVQVRLTDDFRDVYDAVTTPHGR